MRIEPVDALVRRALHHNPPAALQGFLEEPPQPLLERLAFEVVEQNFGHPVPARASLDSRAWVYEFCGMGSPRLARNVVPSYSVRKGPRRCSSGITLSTK